MKKNPILTKYNLSLAAIFIPSFAFFSCIIIAFGIRDGAFFGINSIPAAIVCYFFEGAIAVKFKGEKPEYKIRKHKNKAIGLFVSYIAAITLFLVLIHSEVSAWTASFLPIALIFVHVTAVIFMVAPRQQGPKDTDDPDKSHE